MKKKLLRATISVVIVVCMLTIPALATVNGWVTSCPRCGSTSGTHYDVGSVYYHQTTCICGTVYNQEHYGYENDQECDRCGGGTWR